jgi:hypothetical protein
MVGCSAAVAHACMDTESKGEIAEGRLSVRTFKDGMGRPETVYILTPPTSQCLKGPSPEDSVASTDIRRGEVAPDAARQAATHGGLRALGDGLAKPRCGPPARSARPVREALSRRRG